MKILFPFLVILLNILTSCQNADPGNYSITVELQNNNNTNRIYLQAYHGKALHIIDTATLTENNRYIFKGDRALLPGMYSLDVANIPSVNFLISDSSYQNFTIAVDLNDRLHSVTFTGSPENQAFIEYIHFLKEQQRAQNSQTAIRQKGEEIIQQFPHSMLALSIQSMREPEIPKSGYSAENAREYTTNYYARHFFDYIDFSDQRQLRMPFLEQKLSVYFTKIAPPVADSTNKAIELVLEKASANQEVYQWAVRYLYNLYRGAPIPGNTEVYNFIGENYILTEPDAWEDAAFVEKVKKRVANSKLNPVGEKAANLVLQTPEGNTRDLYNVEATFTILFFYNPDCEACQPVSEALAENYTMLKSRGAEVFAVYLGCQKEIWQEYIAAKNLSWINVYNPTCDATIDDLYDIYATPMIYLLDKNKKVLAKDISVDQIEANYIPVRMQ